MDPKLKIVLAVVAGALGGMLLLGSAFAVPALIHAVAAPAIRSADSFGPGMMGDRGGMMGQRDSGPELGGQRGGMMGPRGTAPQGGCGQFDGSGVCPGGDPSLCPNSSDATGTSL